MTILCPRDGCFIRVPFADWGMTFQSNQTALSSSEDCFQGVLYLTDDPGAEIIDDTESDPFLKPTGTPTYIRASDVEKHWAECSQAKYELDDAFSKAETGFGQRVEGIYVAVVDTDNETFVEAFNRIILCFTCFTIVAAPIYLSDKTTKFSDSSDSVDLASAITAWSGQPQQASYFPTTLQISELAETDNETATFTYQYGQESDRVWVFGASQGCRFKKDENCDPVIVDGAEQQEPYFQNTGLAAAMVAGSWGSTDTNLNATLWNSPIGKTGYGRISPLTIPDSSAQGERVAQGNDRYNITGYIPGQGKRSSATRHANAFFAPAVGNKPAIGEGLDSSGKWFFDTWRAINIIRSDSLLFSDEFYSTGARGTANKDRNAFVDGLKRFLNRRAAQGLMSDYGGNDWLDRGYNAADIVDSTAEWVITAEPVTDIPQNILENRTGFRFVICFKFNTPQHGVQVVVCDLGKIPALV